MDRTYNLLHSFRLYRILSIYFNSCLRVPLGVILPATDPFLELPGFVVTWNINVKERFAISLWLDFGCNSRPTDRKSGVFTHKAMRANTLYATSEVNDSTTRDTIPLSLPLLSLCRLCHTACLPRLISTVNVEGFQMRSLFGTSRRTARCRFGLSSVLLRSVHCGQTQNYGLQWKQSHRSIWRREMLLTWLLLRWVTGLNYVWYEGNGFVSFLVSTMIRVSLHK